MVTTEEQRKKVLHYLEDADVIFRFWTGGETNADGDNRDREPIIAIAAMLQAEANK